MFGFDAMRRVEVVTLGERLDREVGEDRGKPIGHPGVVVGVAATAEREIHRPVERPKRLEVEVPAIERVEEGPNTRGPLRHPRWRRALWRRWWLNTGREL